MASVLGMLEERETAARVRVEGLREEVARLAGVLEAAEIELDRRVIAREELVEALAVSAAETTAVTGAEAEQEIAPSPVPGSIVPALARRIAGDGAGAGLPADPGRGGGARSDRPRTAEGQGDHGQAGPWDDTGEGRGGALEGQAPGGARVARAGDIGDVQRRPAARGRARRRPIRVTIDHRIIASLLAGNVS